VADLQQTLIYATKQEALLHEMIRRSLNHEMTVEVLNAVVKDLQEQLKVVNAKNETLECIIGGLKDEKAALELHVIDLTKEKNAALPVKARKRRDKSHPVQTV